MITVIVTVERIEFQKKRKINLPYCCNDVKFWLKLAKKNIVACQLND